LRRSAPEISGSSVAHAAGATGTRSISTVASSTIRVFVGQQNHVPAGRKSGVPLVVRIRRHAAVAAAVVLTAAGWAALPTGAAARQQAQATTTPPSVVTIKIPFSNFFGSTFKPSTVTLARGGTLWVKNNDDNAHTVTSTTGLFDTLVRPGQRVRVAGVGRLPAGRYPFHCRFHPNMTGVLVIRGSGGSLPSGQLFKQPLKLPPVLTGANITLPIKQTAVRVLPDGSLTKMWTYGNTYPGPIIERPAGQDTKLTFVDQLPGADGSFSVHLHGDHHTSADDGQPDTNLIGTGQRRTYDYPLKDGGKPERASTFIYHDHRMGLTGRNVWKGLEGLFIVHDAKERSLPLPKGRYDVPLLFSDRSFTKDNQLTNPFATEQLPPDDVTVGNKVLVDGRYAPYLNVDTHRYRLRLVNGSNFQSYTFKLSDGRSFTQIGTGDGLLPHPVTRSTIMLGPFQRADVVVNFAGEMGKRIVLKSVARTDSPPAGSLGTPPVSLMQFRVTRSVADSTRVPSNLAAPPALTVPAHLAYTWTVDVDPTTHAWTINGQSFDPNRIDHTVTLGTTEKWKIVNDSPITHFIHLHEEQWQTILRDGHSPPAWEKGIEDTWRLDPGESIVVAAKFTDYTGPFMIHCHMLDHEDHGLMADFDVEPAGTPAPAAFTRVHRMAATMPGMPGMAGMPGEAVDAAATRPLPGSGATASSATSDGVTSFLQRFAIRLVCLLALLLVVRLVRARTGRGRTA
jgi:FtsP/CotA-like multicopper oxidase with cupredoxin domain